MVNPQFLQEYSNNDNLRRSNSLKLAKYFNISIEEVQEIRKAFISGKSKEVYNRIVMPLSSDSGKFLTEDGNNNVICTTNHTITPKDGGFNIELSGDVNIEDTDELLRMVKLNPKNFEVVRFWRGFKKGKWWASLFVKPTEKITDTEDLKTLFTSICEQFVELKKNKPKKVEYFSRGKKHLGVVCMFDIHIGRDSLENQTGEKSIQESDLYKEFMKIHNILLSTTIVDNIHLIIGNDFFNVNDQRLTTVKGTPQNNVNDLYSVYKTGLSFLMYCIDTLEKIAPVKVILVPGNHAEYTETLLASSLKAVFRNNSNVEVDDRPMDRKYFKHGKTLIGYSHGVLPPAQYAKLLPFEAKDKFSECESYYMLLGDKHHENTTVINPVSEVDGITVMQLAALAKKDVWTTKSGYMSRRQSYLMVFDERSLKFQYSNFAD